MNPHKQINIEEQFSTESGKNNMSVSEHSINNEEQQLASE